MDSLNKLGSHEFTIEETTKLIRSNRYRNLSESGRVLMHELYDLRSDDGDQAMKDLEIIPNGTVVPNTGSKRDRIVINMEKEFVKQPEHWLEKWIVEFDKNMDSDAVIYTMADRLGLSIVPDMDNENRMSSRESFIYEFSRKIPEMKKKTTKTIGKIV